MNKRFKQLAKQAGMQEAAFVEDYGRDETHWTSWDSNLEKFGNSILLDCRFMIADLRIANTNADVDNALVDLLLIMEKHFGVTK
jgi:hypothetical protein